VALAGGLALAIAACSDPAGPTAQTRLEIVGPDAIAPGQSVQYTAMQVSADGSRRPATSVVWSSGVPELFTVSQEGVATAQQMRGEAGLQVQAAADASSRVTRTIMVIPAGTYRVVGTVMETGGTSIPVWGARLETARDPDFTSLVTFSTAGPDGRFKLYGVPPDGFLRIQADGYETRTERIQASGHETRNYELRLTNDRLHLNGRFLITFHAGLCYRDPLPDALRLRTYEATITQNGPRLSVVLTAPQFQVVGGLGDRFAGTADAGGGATFTLSTWGDPYYGAPQTYPDVVEKLPDGTLLAIHGRAQTAGTGGPGYVWVGEMSHHAADSGGLGRYLAGCSLGGISLARHAP
jgi:hypothetical protein